VLFPGRSGGQGQQRRGPGSSRYSAAAGTGLIGSRRGTGAMLAGLDRVPACGNVCPPHVDPPACKVVQGLLLSVPRAWAVKLITLQTLHWPCTHRPSSRKARPLQT